MDNSWLLLHKNIQNDAPVDCIWVVLWEDNFPFSFNDYKHLLQYFAQFSTTMSAGLRAWKDVKSDAKSDPQHFILQLILLFNQFQGNSFLIQTTAKTTSQVY